MLTHLKKGGIELDLPTPNSTKIEELTLVSGVIKPKESLINKPVCSSIY